MSEEITINFDESGNPQISVKGIKGKGCKALTAALEKALGTTTESKPTNEYHQTEVKANVIRK